MRSRPLRALFGALLLFAGLAGLGLEGQILRARWRGTVIGFPPPIPWSGEPRVGVNIALFGRDPEAQRQALDQIRALGIRRVRQFFPWSALQPERDRWDWAAADALVAAIAAAGLEPVAVLGDSPPWAARRPGPMAPPLDPADFARFAGAFAARYGRWVRFYQIWDEPNLTIGWGGGTPDPAAYAALLEAAARAIRAADPDAVIVLAGLAPTVEEGPWNLADWLFLERLYAAGARETFDIVAAKPYGFDTGPEDRRVDPGILNFSRVILLREVMIRHGDAHKPIWASHWGWNALPAGWAGRPSIWGQVDVETQARYVRQAVDRVRREWPWMGTMFLEIWQPDASPDDPRWGFAVVDPQGRMRPVGEALRAAAQAPPFPPGYSPAAVPLPGGTYGPPPGALYEGAWRFSALGADIGRETGDRLRFMFEGTGLALRVRRGGYRAHLYVWVDGRPAPALPRDERGAYLILTSPDYATPEDVIIPVARGLPYGRHMVEIEAERGWGQWALVGWSVAGRGPDVRIYRGALVLALGAMALGGALLASSLVAGGQAGLPGLPEMAAPVGRRLGLWGAWALSSLMYVGMWWTALEGWGGRRWGEVGWLGIGLLASGAFYLAPRLALTALAGLGLFFLLVLRPSIGLALVAFWAPFYLYPKPFFEKAFSMAELVLLLTTAAGAVRWVSDRGRDGGWKREAADRWMGIFFGAATLSAALATFQRAAWREWRMVILEPLLFYAMARALRMSRSEWGTVLAAFVLGGIGAAGIGLAQGLTGIELITGEAGARCMRGPFGSPNNLALYLGRVFPFLLAFLLRGPSRRLRLLAGLGLIPVLLALVGTCSEGAAFLGAPAALLAMGGVGLWESRGRLSRRARCALGFLAVGLALALGLTLGPRVAHTLAARMATPGSTVFFRVRLWASTLDLLREHPLFGVGPDNFLYWFRSRYIRPDAWQEPNLSHPHNIFLDFWVRTGILGLAAGLAWQVRFWRAALRPRDSSPLDPQRWGAIGAMADVLGHGLVDNGFFLVDLAFAFMVIFLTGIRADGPEADVSGSAGPLGEPAPRAADGGRRHR